MGTFSSRSGGGLFNQYGNPRSAIGGRAAFGATNLSPVALRRTARQFRGRNGHFQMAEPRWRAQQPGSSWIVSAQQLRQYLYKSAAGHDFLKAGLAGGGYRRRIDVRYETDGPPTLFLPPG